MNCIVNVSNDWGIGKSGALLVHLSEDLRFFRENTQGCAVILGKKTLATFPGGRPLKNRRNLVLTRSEEPIEGTELCHSVPETLRLAAEIEKETPCWVIGGEQIYRQFLPYCETALVTKTETALPADAFFPDLDADPQWELTDESEPHEENGVRFRFLTYRNRNPLPLT